MRIALDGPAGAGKSTVAKAIAKELDILYLDTGAMYRAVALYMLEHDIPLEDEDAVRAALPQTRLRVAYENGAQAVYLGERNVSTAIRENHVSAAASAYSALPCVREFLVAMQRQTAQKNDCILDGRDIGTCVLPDAEFKFYLTADASERAKRRQKDLEAKGQSVPFEQLLEEIRKRDYDDSHRAVSPLKQAEDAVLVDSTHMTADEVIAWILSRIKGA